MNDYRRRRVQIAYKKLKAAIYFDKTQLPLRDKLVLFEGPDMERKLSELCDALFNGSGWEAYSENILTQIGVLTYPKKLKLLEKDTAIFNANNIPIELQKPQHFIDLPVEGHILSVLWILSVGMVLDCSNSESDLSGMYEHSYGNRLRKGLLNEETHDVTYAPTLFEPYFKQYESWRDFALEKAKDQLNDNQDALILTLDFQSFYYSLHFEEEDFSKYLDRLNTVEEWHRRVNHFVYQVLQRYSDVLRAMIGEGSELTIKARTVLPLGFLPSNILANWAMTPFDDTIIERWNPVYYGRYVDDIIIVDKVEKNSPLYKKARAKAREKQLTTKDVIQHFLIDGGIMRDENDSTVVVSILANEKNEIRIQSEKVKMFYFRSGSTRALLNCFQTQIAQNASEFRLLPNMDAVFNRRDYSEIFNLQNEEGINKLRGVNGVELDKFSLSKFLGKYQKVSGLIQDEQENTFERDMMVILDERTLIANYGVWERLFEILIINGRFRLYQQMALRILDAIFSYQIPLEICAIGNGARDSMLRVLFSALCRTSALVWGKEMDQVIEKICKRADRINAEERDASSFLAEFSIDNFSLTRQSYCKTRMVNKYVLPFPIDFVLCRLDYKHDGPALHLYSFRDMMRIVDRAWENHHKENRYLYYPYIVTPQELSFAYVCGKLKASKDDIDPDEQDQKVRELFREWNYLLDDQSRFPDKFEEVHTFRLENQQLELKNTMGRSLYVTHVTTSPQADRTELTIAIGNVAISNEDFKLALDGRPNRSYQRYEQFEKIFNDAIREKAEMLVLPENYLPFEWIPEVARRCAKNHIAIITGVEHIVIPQNAGSKRDRVYNLTVTILPYRSDGYDFAHVSFHNKVEYSPQEKEEIEGRRLAFHAGNTYQLFCWRDVWFPVYCCFELASIQDRALFQSYADMVVAVEWNKDVAYFSNIVESLSRDLHCYCVQVNSSDYGDSRLLAPSSSIRKDIIKTKGGRNSCILVDCIDISTLRDFQMLEYSLQIQESEDKSFKPSPPGLDREIIERKRKHTLFSTLRDSRAHRFLKRVSLSGTALGEEEPANTEVCPGKSWE